MPQCLFYFLCARREGGRERDIIIFIYTTLLQASKLLFFLHQSISNVNHPPSYRTLNSFSNPSFSTVDINTVTIETLCVYMNVCLYAAMYNLMRCSRPFIHQPFTPSAIRPIFLVIPQPKALNGRGNIFKKNWNTALCVCMGGWWWETIQLGKCLNFKVVLYQKTGMLNKKKERWKMFIIFFG